MAFANQITLCLPTLRQKEHVFLNYSDQDIHIGDEFEIELLLLFTHHGIHFSKRVFKAIVRVSNQIIQKMILQKLEGFFPDFRSGHLRAPDRHQQKERNFLLSETVVPLGVVVLREPGRSVSKENRFLLKL